MSRGRNKDGFNRKCVLNFFDFINGCVNKVYFMSSFFLFFSKGKVLSEVFKVSIKSLDKTSPVV